jgi:AcrR family transcriptional regulator
MSGQDGSQDWVEAGFDALAQGGIDRVRIEVLAQSLRVTKGGFYRRFKDRPALLKAMLETWVEGRIAVIERQTELAGDTPRERLRDLVRLFAERMNARGLSIELAVRQWARSDAGAATAVSKVDAMRLERVTGLYAQLGFEPADAEARGVILYAFIFGQALLMLETPLAQREAMIEACAAILSTEAG